MVPAEAETYGRSVQEQVERFYFFVPAAYLKPHGALYNMAVRDEKIAEAIAHAILAVDPALILFAPANSAMELAGKNAGLKVAREIFADRNYLNDGWLVPRTRPDALLHDPNEAAERVLRMLREGKVRSVDGCDVEVNGETICVHGDTPGAVEFARKLRTRLFDGLIQLRLRDGILLDLVEFGPQR